LYACDLDITRQKIFEDSNFEQIDKKLLESSIFLETISAQDLENLIMKIMNLLSIDFSKDHLIRCFAERIESILR